MREMIMRWAAVLTAACATWAIAAPVMGQSRDTYDVDPGTVAGWLPGSDPWREYDRLPAPAYCRLYIVDGRVENARRDRWRDDRYHEDRRSVDRYDARRYAQRDGGDYVRGIVVAGRCITYHDYLSLYRPWVAPFTLRDLAELERARARLSRDAYPLGPYGEDARFGDPYSGRPEPYPEEHRLREQLRENAGVDESARAPAVREAQCVVLNVSTAAGRRLRVRLPLPMLGAATPEAVADAIENELAAGRAINVGGLDGLALRLSATETITRMIVAACAP